MDRIEKALRDAKFLLIRDAPFLASRILISKPTLFVNKHFPAATDGHVIYITKSKLEDVADDELVKVMTHLLSHEVMHIVLQHVARGVGKNKIVFNMAADIIVDTFLTSSILKGGILDTESHLNCKKQLESLTEFIHSVMDRLPHKEADMLEEKYHYSWYEQKIVKPFTVENLYNFLTELFELANVELEVGIHPMDEVIPREMDEEEKIETESVLEGIKSAGRLPGVLEDEYQTLIVRFNPIKFLAGIIGKALKSIEAQLRVPSRRGVALNSEYVIEGFKSSRGAKILIAIDGSGSIGPTEFGAFVGIVDKFSSVSSIDVIVFDATVQDFMEDYELRTKKVKFKGRGGTAIKEVIEFLVEHSREYDLFILLTDGHIFDHIPYKELPIKSLFISTDKPIEEVMKEYPCFHEYYKLDIVSLTIK